jgi:hypothetical protein
LIEGDDDDEAVQRQRRQLKIGTDYEWRNDDAEVTTDADSSGEKLMMLLRPRINSERTKEATESEDAEDDSPNAEKAQVVDDC